ncbi:acetyl esterase [Sphingomonas sp. PP-F2F-A104-K0414]|uniref:alpha/beta hydrolase n=1 Tax=Sphingomonas sp. PP-F2F-A104-K0414 TaxID=2135661 RepID=UPI00104B0F1E|nr:alpha/beta hydrolase [Sphingomonas sp. PP-F2F-A104-K0414]TCP95870.1 acetyl esterase [Sphingomonas sp. PP-F2F-A104-K0414]
MTLDPGIAQLLDAVAASGAGPVEEGSVEEFRALVASLVQFQAPAPEMESVIDTMYPTQSGSQFARIFMPGSNKYESVMLFFHGGGFVAGDAAVYDEPCRSLAAATGSVVVYADYRLAPEHPYPAALDDAAAALAWVAVKCREWGGDPARLIIVGESAGGNLAALTAIRARDAGGPPVAAQVLINPGIGGTAATRSRSDFAEGYMISAKAMDWMWQHYMQTTEDSALSDPAEVSSLVGLPPALTITMEYDVLRDSGEAYAARLAQAGTPSTVARIDGLIHASMALSGITTKVGEINRNIADFVGALFGLAGRPD